MTDDHDGDSRSRSVSPDLAGPWPDTRDAVLAELDRYLRAVSRLTPGAATRCRPWTVSDVTAHLAASFSRFNAMLDRGRAGDLGAPFGRNELSQVNLRDVRAFTGDADHALRSEVERFVEEASELDEVMPHQFGPIPVRLQLGFGLSELALHHDDVAATAGDGCRPPDEVIAALVVVWDRALGGVEREGDRWSAILRASGR